MEFQLNGNEFIPLNALLKMMNIPQTGGHANVMITNEEVLVNGEIETAKRKKIRVGDRVEAQGTTITVMA